ncbi:MAG: PSP1 C-terminal domain-containing protein [Pirellulaceae bacterium]|nr:PSP1 domain-containing protein [Pirellulales bacterium]
MLPFPQYLVRVGAMGNVGRFRAVEPVQFTRHCRVICRTARGLEVGEVLARVDAVQSSDCDGELLRQVAVEDDLLLARLEKNRDAAFQACCELLEERQIENVLLDVEQLFDGSSLYFYFLGDVSDELETLTSALAVRYDSQVQFSQFAEAVIAGCGPDCGTESAAGNCGEGGCSTCALAKACH